MPTAAVASMTEVVGYALRNVTPSRFRISAIASTIFISDLRCVPSNAQQRFEVLPEDRFLLLLREARHALDPCDGPVERHVVRPVRAEHHAIDADGVDEEAQRRLRVHDAVVVELPQIGTRRQRRVHARLRAYLPRMI